MTFKQKLAEGETLVGTFLKTPSPTICEVLGRTTLDFLCIDAEHNPFDRRDISDCVLACRSVGLPNLVRLPIASAEHIATALDCGAGGFVAPHLMSAEDAQMIVAKSDYKQSRGFCGGTRAAGTRTLEEHVRLAGGDTVVIGQIEDIEAVQDLDAILDVDGIDCYFIGRSDLTLSMGHTDRNHPDVIATVEDITSRAVARGRRVGTFTSDLSELPKWREMGINLFLLGSEQGFMINGTNTFLEDVRGRF